ncbi:unnamed protein product [Clavelina lepadiformis]|uniref:Dynein axonemal assembly factor 4 n=1 Tax=Clavelina lepadiformis TaxID=159417 RepID=A0ABP0GQ26_CLALP
MPIIVKDYQWSETDEKMFVQVPLKGVKQSKADIFCTEEFVKVSFPPFLFEALLFAPIDDDKSTATIRDGSVTFNLLKKEPVMWSQLLSIHSDNKSFVLKKKQEAIEYAQKKSEDIVKRKSSAKEENKKYSLKEMMKLEEADRDRIEQIKVSERNRAMDEFTRWKEEKKVEAELEKMQLLEEYKVKILEENKENEGCKISEIFVDDNSDVVDGCRIIELQEDPPLHKANDATEKLTAAVNHDLKPEADKKKSKVKRQGAGPRQRGKISVNFTPRVFPTPQRESKAVEEDEWLQKQADARKQHAINDPDLAQHEKDPAWLKDKGGQLFASGDYMAAINAFNLAIRIQPRMPILFLNRAACHLRLRNLYKCAEDCSTSLDLMVPKVAANAKGRLKAHLRRAAAFCDLELYVEALQDYEAALKIEPKNEKLIEDADKIRTVIQSSTG